jgi:hypothetical protein
MPTASIVAQADGYIVVFAESLKQAPWWRYHTLINGDGSSSTHGVDDPDNFCVYNAQNRKILWMEGDSHAGHIFRIHDGNHVSIVKKTDTVANVTVFKKSFLFSGIHQCTGSATPGCDKKTDLKLNSLGLSYPWELPGHIAVDKSQRDVKL